MTANNGEVARKLCAECGEPLPQEWDLDICRDCHEDEKVSAVRSPRKPGK